MENWEIITHLGEDREKYYGAVVPPVYQTSNFVFKDVNTMQDALADEYHHAVYSRGNNPGVAILRQKLAALEGADDALVFSSGCAAITCLLLSQLKKGDHMVCVSKPYGWVSHICNHILSGFGIEFTFVELSETDAGVSAYIEASRNETRLWYLESPNTFTFEITDIENVANAAREKGIKTAIDNSFCTPLFQKPISMGIDFVVHSASKYISGHSDLVAGILCGKSEAIKAIYDNYYLAMGAVISPHDASLMLRGLRTLPLRLKQSCDSAKIILQGIEKHPAIDKIFYPFHSDFLNTAVAQKQMISCSGMFSILLKVNSMEDIRHFCDSLNLFSLAVSWGGFESLVFPAMVFSQKYMPESVRLPENLVRFYIGLEDPLSLSSDIMNALDNISKIKQV